MLRFTFQYRPFIAQGKNHTRNRPKTFLSRTFDMNKKKISFSFVHIPTRENLAALRAARFALRHHIHY